MLKELRIGQDGEDRVIQLFNDIGLPVERENAKTYDLVSGSPAFKVEVKNDIYAARSGNVAIEILNSRSNKASGLTATTSDIWAHLAYSKIHICPTKKLKEFVNTATPHRIIEKGGDGNAMLLLFKYDVILPIFTLEEDITKEIVLSWIS